MASARAQTRFIFETVQLPDGSFPRDALLNGGDGAGQPRLSISFA